jgi:hypothetical protein
MHNILRTQSKENELATLPTSRNDINNDSQVIDLQGVPPSEISDVEESPSAENTPHAKNTENSEKNI